MVEEDESEVVCDIAREAIEVRPLPEFRNIYIINHNQPNFNKTKKISNVKNHYGISWVEDMIKELLKCLF